MRLAEVARNPATGGAFFSFVYQLSSQGDRGFMISLIEKFFCQIDADDSKFGRSR